MDISARSLTPPLPEKRLGEGEDDTAETLEPIRRTARAKESVPMRREGSLTMVAKDDDEPEEDEKTAEPGTRPPSERARKLRFPRRPPRIDPHMCQVQVPNGPFDRNARPPSPTNPEVRVVWTGEMTEEVLSYLAFCRRLLGKGDIPVTEPLEEDEQALEFLEEHGGKDVERAKLMLIASAGGGAEVASITLEQLHENKVRPRTKGVFRSWVGGEFRAEVDHPDANNPAKVKQMWKDWTARCKKALGNSQTTAVELAAFQKEERNLPRFQSKGTTDEDAIVSGANEQSIDLESRVRDIELYAAEIHDALSLVHPERRFTAAELCVFLLHYIAQETNTCFVNDRKRLADEAPRKVQIKEVDILKNLVSRSEAWEKRAQKWLQEDDESAPSAYSGSNGGAPSSATSRRRGGGGNGATNPSSARSVRDKEFTMASLNELIREGKQSSIDHSATLLALTKKRAECESLLKKLTLHVPQDKSWKQNKKKYEILSLSTLKELRDEMRRSKLRFPQAGILDSHIAQAEEWVEAARRSSSSAKCTIKELQALLAKADQIPVNLADEKKVLEQFLARAVDWIKRAKAFFPPTNSTAVVTGPTKKTRANIAAFESGDGGFQKGGAEDFLALRDEANEIGLDSLVEAATALEVAETVEDWIARVNEAMKDITDDKLDLLQALLYEAESLPVIVPEERELRSVTAKRSWSREAAKLLSSAPGTIRLGEMESQLVEADRLFPAESGRKKKVKRSTMLDNEGELRVHVEQARDWMSRANQILLATPNSEKFETYQAVRDLLLESVQADVSEIKMNLVKRVRSIARWQRETREVLLRTGVVAQDDFQGLSVCDEAILKDLPLIDAESDDEDEVDEKQPVNENGGDMDVVVSPHGTSSSEGATKDLPITDDDQKGPHKVSLNQFRDMLQEAQKIGFRVPELDVLTRLEGQVKEWQSRFAVVSSDSTTLSTISGSVVKSKKRRRADHDSTLPTPARLALQEDDLELLKRDAHTLPVDVSEHLQTIDTCLNATVEWRKLCEEPLERYRRVSRDYLYSADLLRTTANQPAAVMCYAPFAKDQLTEDDAVGDDVLEKLQLVVKDSERRQEKFPYDREADALWWRDDYPEPVRQAIQEVVSAMREAEKRNLHLTALDSPPVRACSWLIQAENWLDEVRKEFLNESSTKPKTLWSLCQAVLNGLHLLASAGRDEQEDPLPEDFPQSALNEYNPPESLLAMMAANSSTTTASSIGGPAPSKRSRKTTQLSTESTPSMDTTTTAAAGSSLDSQATMSTPSVPDASQGDSEAAAGVFSEHPATQEDEWRILKYCRISTCREAEGVFPPSLGVPCISGIILRRLYGLERAAQAALASRALAKRLNRIPREERTQAKLKQHIAQSMPWSRTIPVEEDPRFRHELTQSEAWADEKRRTMNARKSSIDQLEKLASRGEKVWVDQSQIVFVRSMAKQASEWVDAFKKTGVEEGQATVPIETLKDLLKRGEKLQGVDVSTELELLKKATQIFCMCAGARDKQMMQCSVCTELFHMACLGGFYPNVCPICNVMRAIQRCMGLANAAVCRALALEAYLHDPVFAQQVQATSQVVIQDVESSRLVVEWMRQVRPLLEPDRVEGADSTTLAQELPLIPDSIKNCPEVKAVMDAVTARRWKLKLEALRRRPALADLESVLRSAPNVLGESVRGLEYLRDRGARAFQMYNEIWNCPDTTPMEDILRNCGELSDLLDHLPLEGVPAMARAVDACIEDQANRHCLCNKFDNGRKMVSCGKCSRWFHDECLKATGIPKFMGDLDSDEDFFCPECLSEVQQPL